MITIGVTFLHKISTTISHVGLAQNQPCTQQNRINYMNFIRFTMKLYRTDVKDQKKIAVLKKEINSSTNVADKGWLMEKILEVTQF